MFKPSTHVANPEDGYEKTDVKAKLIVIGTIVSVVLTMLSFGVAFMVTKFLVSDARDYSPEGSYRPVDSLDSDWTSPTRLQMTPEQDLKNYKAESKAKSAAFGSKEGAEGIYHIPVDEAINLVSDNGKLPELKATESAN
jgi:hypothetical protein